MSVQHPVTLPQGTVTFLFTDIEGSTRLLERFGERLTSAMARHHDLLGSAIAAQGGVVFETVGDAVYAAFIDPVAGVLAAAAAQRAMGSTDWAELGDVRIRVAVHRGDVELRGSHYLGPALFRAARILALAHGGQVLVSDAIADAVRGRLPAGLGLRGLGRHRLKDLVEPEEVTQLTGEGLPDGFPPLRAVGARTHLLPRPVSAFFGRETELAKVAEALESARLVTLVATGGTGKTRLAVEVAGAVASTYRDGVAFVDLAPISDPALIAGAIASTLGVRAIGDEGPEAALGRWLADRELLLITDNLEQIPSAGRVLSGLLEGAPDLRILATGRERLHVRGERVVPLDPLPLDVGPEGSLPAAARLFLDRAGLDTDGLATVDRDALMAIVRRLDGLPLAIEIAAARAPSIPLPLLRGMLDRRLPGLTGPDDLPDRQRTLRATITWSVRLLDVDPSRLFTGLSVFVGGWPLAAVVPVLAPTFDEDDALLTMSALVEKSLVRAAGADPWGIPRYALLETTRQVAAEMVDPDRRTVLRDRHAAWVADLVERAEPELTGHDAIRWLDMLDQEWFGIVAATEHALAHGDATTAQRITGATWVFGWVRSIAMASLADLARRAVELSEPTPPRVRARALNAFAALGQSTATPDITGAAAREAIDLLEPLGPSNDLAEAWCTLGSAHANHGRLEGVEDAMHRALAIWEQLGDARGQAKALRNVAGLQAEQGRLHEAIAALDRAHLVISNADLFVAVDEVLNEVDTLLLADLVPRAADRLWAATRLRRGQPGADPLTDTGFVVLVARLLVRVGQAEVAIRLHAAAQAALLRLGLHEEFTNRMVYDPILSDPDAQWPASPTGVASPSAHERQLLRAEGRALALGAAIAQAEAAMAALAETGLGLTDAQVDDH